MGYKQLEWYGHVHRMPETRLPTKVWEWIPRGEDQEVDLRIPGLLIKEGLRDEGLEWNGKMETNGERS